MRYLFLFLLCLGMACNKNNPGGACFSEVPRSHTNIDFRNLLVEKETFNIFKYQYFYNGGGTAVGDFDNDGMIDVFFTGNMVKNRLFLNKGNFEFEDATKTAGIAEFEGWCTGATPVDINQDGWLDIYVCRAGYPFDNLRSNLLFINEGATGKLHFSEQAAAYGLADLGHSTQASFFDYDKDGDLDMFLINHSTVEYSRGSLDFYSVRNKKNPDFTNKLFRNDSQPGAGQATFVNVTDAAHISSNVLSFSLGLCTADVNLDGWPDIFVANDFNEPDYLFINQHDGTFRESLSEWFDHTSIFSMGSDIADFSGDGFPDLLSLDMLPESNEQQKLHTGADNFEKVYQMMRSGFFKQYSRNMLQLNNGDGTFTEVGQLAGVSNTDWSWAALMFDFDNDGARDLFISNGYPKDHTNMDFLKFTAGEALKLQKGEEAIGFQDYLKKMPPLIEPNYYFKNEGNLHFSNQTKAWGMDKPVVTQSAAWADFDNDGDLDLALNNTNEYADIIRNNSEQNPANHWLRIKLKGRKANPLAVGAKIRAWAGKQVFYAEQIPVRGFQSSMDPVLSIGLGAVTQLDSLLIVWPTDEMEVLRNVKAKQTLELNIETAKNKWTPAPPPAPRFFSEVPDAVSFEHRENEHNDLKKQSLLPWFFSRQGPALATADVNGDGLDDLYCGGAKDQPGQILLQNNNGRWAPSAQSAFQSDSPSEDVDACFFDADGDKDMDLYVCSGGYEFEANDPALQDRLYLNDGRGTFSKTALPVFARSSAVVCAADMDADGDQDLYVGGAYQPQRYPEREPGVLLRNEGNGRFSMALELPGADAALWCDLNKDGLPELILAGEWMPVAVFDNKNGQLQAAPAAAGNGMWTALTAADLDADGDMDLVAGNLGQNTQLHARPDEPLELYAGDFDKNGSVDPLLFHHIQGKSWPLASMEDITGQLPYLRKKFMYFKDYANAQVQDILSAEQIKNARHLQAGQLESVWLENRNGTWVQHVLPPVAQVAPVEAILTADINGDQLPDIILAGNRSCARVRLGSLDGNHGQLYLNDGKGGFQYVSQAESGLRLRGDVRALAYLRTRTGAVLCAGVNNSKPVVYQKK